MVAYAEKEAHCKQSCTEDGVYQRGMELMSLFASRCPCEEGREQGGNREASGG